MSPMSSQVVRLAKSVSQSRFNTQWAIALANPGRLPSNGCIKSDPAITNRQPHSRAPHHASDTALPFSDHESQASGAVDP
jgi:hypothetical protein